MGQAMDILSSLMGNPEIAAFSSKRNVMEKNILESVLIGTYTEVDHAIGYREVCLNLNEMLGRALMNIADQEMEAVTVHVNDLELKKQTKEVWCSKCGKFKRPVDWRRKKWQFRICPTCAREKSKLNKSKRVANPTEPDKSEKIEQSEKQAYQPTDGCIKCGASATHMIDEILGDTRVKVCITCGWENWI